MRSAADRTTRDRLHNAVVERVALPLGDLVIRTEFLRELRRWRQIQTLPADRLATLQRTGLTTLLRHATEHVPHYRDLLVPASEDPYEWLRQFPILTKADLREHGDRMITPGVDGLVKVSSSGSSGFQSTLWASPRELSRSLAIQTLWWEWDGYRLGDRLLQTGMTPDRGITKGVKDQVLRVRYLVAFGPTDDELAVELAQAARRNLRVLGGYASSLDALGRVALERGIEVRFDSAISWGDKLYPSYRQRIRDAFGCDVLDTYGTGEGFMIAAQRGEGPYLVMSPHVVVELLDDADQPVAPGEMGRVVITRLDATSMPIVRFNLGDLAVAPATPTPLEHGPAFPQLERIVGRETDVWRSPGGRTLTVHTFTGVLEHVEEIQQFCVRPSPGHLELCYRSEEDLDGALLDRVAARLCEVVGERLDISWKRVDHIANSPSGKPQIIQSASPPP